MMILIKAIRRLPTISLLGFLGFIAVAIATLGLLGIVIYTVEVKGKEISIRKIIGANEKQLGKFLIKRLCKIIGDRRFNCYANWLDNGDLFLQNFAYAVNFGFLNVVLCFCFCWPLACLLLYHKTYKAATANP
jgi:putative ABC transport system permease protein